MRKGRRVRNLYVQLDNVYSNKSYTVLAAMSMLVLLGICRKVKLSYLVVGHTHEDVDATIGNTVTHLRSCDQPTFTRFQSECHEAIKKEGGRIMKVERIVGISDFDLVSQRFNDFKVEGITAAHLIRLTAKSDGSGVDCFYKRDSTAAGSNS